MEILFKSIEMKPCHSGHEASSHAQNLIALTHIIINLTM